MVKILKAAVRRVKLPDAYAKFDSNTGMFMAVTGKPRGE
jgi:hypothetical protein